MTFVRTLGLTALATIALVALPGMATASPGEEFTSKAYPASVSGKNVGSYPEFQTSIGSSTCTQLELKGTLVAATGQLPTEATAKGCSFYGLDFNDCKLVFYPGPEKGGVIQGSLGITGPECTGVDITYGSPVAVIPPQRGLAASLSNVGGAIVADIEAQFDYEYLGETRTDGYLSATIEMKGNNGAIQVAPGSPPGSNFLVAGSTPPRFTSDFYPGSLAGVQSQEHEITFEVGGLTCEDIAFSGQATGASSKLALDASNENCLLSGIIPVTVDMNSCHYEFNALSGSGPFTATQDVVCSQKGDGIDVDLESKPCIRIPGQSGLKGVQLSNVTSSGVTSVKITSQIKGLTYSLSLPCGSGTRTDGTYEGATTVSLTN